MSANFKSNPASSRSKFMSNFEASRPFEQHGVDERLWSNPPTQRGALHDLGQARNGASFDSLTDLNGFSTRPTSSSSRFANGTGGFGDMISDEYSPARQRNAADAHTTQQNRPFDSSPLPTPLSLQMDPTAHTFHQRAPNPFQPNMRGNMLGTTRESIHPQAARYGLAHDNVGALWPTMGDTAESNFTLPNSQTVSRNNSQAVSRNNSLPPSRHGLDHSPTESTFNSGTFNGLRSSSFASDRPSSRDQLEARLGQMSLTQNRQSSSNLHSLGSDSFRMPGHPTANGMSQRHGSIGSRSNASEAMSRISEYQQMSGHFQNDYDQTVPLPRTHTLTMAYENGSAFPTLSSDFQVRQNGGSRNHIGSLRLADLRRGGAGGRPGGNQQQQQQQSQSSIWPGHSMRGPSSVSQGSQAAADMSDDSLVEHMHGFYPSLGNFNNFVSPGSHGPAGFDGSPPAYGASAGNQYLGGSSQLARSVLSSEQLVSGPNWTERVRPSTSQKYIETSPDCRLRDVLGHVARFCGDQAGSRFLQDKLEVANSDDKEAVFQELLPNTIQLCSDPFGNYVIQKFFEHGTQRQKEQLAKKMHGKVRDLSMNSYGCRCIQKAFEHVLCDQQATLVQELRPCLFEVSKHSHGNHVIQKAIERLPREDIQFILHGYHERVMEMSLDQYGCRVIQRLLEIPDEAEMKARLIQEIHGCANHLVMNMYGNYVVQHIIDHGRPADRRRLFKTVQPIVVELMNNKFASNVVEKCLRQGTDEERRALVGKIAEIDPETKKPRHLKSAMTSSYSNYVIQRILKTLPEELWRPFAALLEQELDEMKMKGHTDRKLEEFRRLIAKGPPTAAEIAAEAESVRKEARRSRSSTNTGTPSRPQHPTRRANRPQTDDAFARSMNDGTPPLLMSAEPSPQSSSSPSTHDSVSNGPVSSVAQQEPIANGSKRAMKAI